MKKIIIVSASEGKELCDFKQKEPLEFYPSCGYIRKHMKTERVSSDSVRPVRIMMHISGNNLTEMITVLHDGAEYMSQCNCFLGYMDTKFEKKCRFAIDSLEGAFRAISSVRERADIEAKSRGILETDEDIRSIDALEEHISSVLAAIEDFSMLASPVCSMKEWKESGESRFAYLRTFGIRIADAVSSNMGSFIWNIEFPEPEKN